MNLQKSRKGLVLAALIVVAVGVLALALGGGNKTSSVAAPIDQFADDAAPGDAMSQVDKVLGRSSSTAGKVGGIAGQSAPYDVKPAPAQREATSGSAGANSSIAAAPAVPPAPGGGPAETNALTADRKIVQTASIRLQVKQVGGSFEEVSRLATASGGFVASSNFSFQGDQQIASTTIRVPAARYQEVLGQLRSLGAKVDSESSNASDITEEYSDLTARLRNLEATETQLLTFLSQAKNVGEVLQVQDRLNNTRNDIERAKGRMNLLDKLSDLATITVQLRPVAATTHSSGSSSGIGAEVTRAWQDSLDFLGGIATTVVTAIVFVWWLPVVGVPAYVAWRRFGRGLTPQAQVVARD